MDGQLRDLLDAAAGDPPHRVTVQAVRRRMARRRVTEGVAAAVAAVLLIGLGVAVSAQVTSPRPAGGGYSPADLPGDYIQQSLSGASASLLTVVRATATGAVTATVSCPWPHARIAAQDVAAANHTFFIVCQKETGPGASVVTGSRIYQFRVSESGRISGYTVVPGGILNGLRVGGIAASSDGSEIAVTTAPGASRSPLASIMVINARTGARAVWRNGGNAPGTTSFEISDLSLTSDGRELVFLAVTQCIQNPRCEPTGEEVRALSPAASGGQLDSGQLLLQQSALTGLSAGYINGAVVSPDGSALTLVIMHSGPQSDTASVVQFSAATGRQTRVLYQMPTGNGFSYQFFSSDPSGRYLLLDVGPTSGEVNGWIDYGQLVPLTPPDGDDIFYETW
jgi:type IV secretory pathway VirB2 component (pilin)